MTIFATIYDNRYDKIFDVSNVLFDLEISTKIEDDPGKATFKLLKVDEVAFWEGATVSITVDDYPMFKGFVFSKSRNEEVDIISVVCYDQLRYLKNKDSIIVENMTSSDLVSLICEKFVLKYEIVDPSYYICKPRNNPNTALYDTIKTALHDTLVNGDTWFILRDNFGTLQHINLLSMKSNIVLGDYSGVSDIKYESSIDKDTYNQIKLYTENKDEGKREIYIVNDTIHGGQNLKEWGILQYYAKVDENLNVGQIEQYARGLLSLFNNTKRTLKLSGVGILHFTAGTIFRCEIENLGDISVNNYLMVTGCKHSFSNNLHTMQLETEVVRDGGLV